MDTYEKILNNGAGSFVDLVESFDEWDIEEMNMGYNREDFKSDFDFKYAVTYAFVRGLLIEYIGCGFTDRETQTLFEIYCAM